MTLPTSTPESSWRGEALPNRFQTGLFPMLWLIFVTATLPTGTPEPSPIIIPVTFRLRLEKFTEQAHHAYRLLRGRLPCAVKSFGPHRASEYALHLPGTAFGLLGVLLEGLSGNRHRFPHQEPSLNRSPAVLRLISGHVLVQCLSGCQCLLRLSATSAPRALQPRPGPVPSRVANASCGCLPPQRCRYSNRVLVLCPGASPEDYFPARCFSQAQAEARVSSIGRSAFQPSSFSARVGSAQMATTSPGRRGANL